MVQSVVLELAGEDGHRRGKEHDGPVGMLAGAAAAHLDGPALEALEVDPVGALHSDSRARVRERLEAEEARAALRRALSGEVARDRGHLTDRAMAHGQDADHATAEA